MPSKPKEQMNFAEHIARALEAREAGRLMRKPGPYDIQCEPCAKLGIDRVFQTHQAWVEHLKHHFFAAAPFRIIAIAK